MGDNISNAGDISSTDIIANELTFDEVADRAADALSAERRAAGLTDLTEAEREAAEERARGLINEASGDSDGALAGMQDMHNLSLSIGLPVPRIIFGALIEETSAPGGRKKAWRRKLKQMSEVQETGCIQVDIQDATVYLVLDGCGPDHDLGAELDKVYSRTPEDRHEEIRKHLSVLVYLGRAAYAQMMIKMDDLLQEVGKKFPAPDSFDPRVLGIDPANTTFYSPSASERRVGIFVRLSDETGSEKRETE